MMGERQRIYNLSTKLNDDDRQALAALLIKAGYTVRIGKERQGTKGAYTYFIEYWKEEEKC